MAVKVVHVSDISGKEAEEQSLGRLVVHEHPEYADLPVTLEVLPEEVESLKSSSRFVTIEVFQPGARKGERLTVALDDFNTLATPGVMDSAIQDALIAKHRTRPSRPSASTTGDGASRSRSKVNYATLEHAGEPHRGRITEAEKELVRDNLEKINKRLRESDKREIDPENAEMRDRYGL
ncbi:MAG TPA: hypothetical protein VG276_25955 [Actinomycetes bacterium]|jgi:hypothetical protein|nr:hypothetical protein [Actinomycetes bacterium]